MNKEFAVIKTGGKQYLVTPGQRMKIEKIPQPKEGNEVIFDKVLAVGDEKNFTLGHPTVGTVRVKAEWIREGKGKKVTIFKYHSKTRYRKKKGHRQSFTEVLIKEIIASP